MTRQVTRNPLAVFDGFKDKAVRDERVIRNMARLLADWMAELHGEEFRIHIDHEIGLVMVRPV